MSRYFLLNLAETIKTQANDCTFYDEESDLLVSRKDSNPICLQEGVITGSKTDCAPGDDDPDPETEICY